MSIVDLSNTPRVSPTGTVTRPGTYVNFALFAFALLGIELLLPFVEQLIPHPVASAEAAVLHWGLTIVLWVGGGIALVTRARRRTDFSIRGSTGTGSAMARYATVAALGLVTLACQWVLRGGALPPFAEYAALSDRFGDAGPTAWLVQVAYYAAEVSVVVLVIAFGQRAGEGWFGLPWLPWGGVVLAATWGLVHVFTQDLVTGLYGVALSLVMGIVFVLCRRSILVTYPILLVLFVI